MLNIKKITSYFKVTTLIWYAKILESNEWVYSQKIISIYKHIRKYLDQMVFKICCKCYGYQKMDQTANLSPESKVQQNSFQVNCSEKVKEPLENNKNPSMLKLPIIFVHYSNSEYLTYSLGQAKHSNPESMIYLIGDETNDRYDFVEHHSFSNYFQGANDFSKIYRHYNSTSYKHEIFCFQRWFILLEFLIIHKLEKCLYLDSDTMLYSDVTNEQKKFAHFDFTLSYLTSGCTFFLNRVEALADYCQFLTDIYSKKERYYYDKMLAQYAIFKKNKMAGGACDMTAFAFYSYDHFGEIGEVAQIINGSVYDPSINVPQPGFEMEKGMKKIIWKNAVPYGIQLKTAKEIKFNSLQFQGGTKHLMGKYYTGSINDVVL